jgi:hypothetical protein
MDDDYDDTGDRYDAALVCANGHVTNDHVHRDPQDNRKYCEQCGQKTIQHCPFCNTEIPGNLFSVSAPYTPPAYCGNCGQAYPWTTTALSAVRALADESMLEASDRDKLKASLDDLVRDTPRTDAALQAFKRLAMKAGQEFYDMAKGILINVASETVKRGLQ